MAAKRTKSRKTRKSLAKHVLLFSLLIAVALLLRIASSGLPAAWADKIAQAVSTDDFAVELEQVSLSLLRGELEANSLKVYRKGSVLGPVVEIDGVSIWLRPRPQSPPVNWVRKVHVNSIRIPKEVATETNAPPEVSRPGRTSAASKQSCTDLPFFGPINVACDKLDLFGTIARNISGEASSSNGVIYLHNAILNAADPREAPQPVSGNVQFNVEDLSIKASVHGSMDPNKIDEVLITLGAQETASEIARFQFPESPPTLDLRIESHPLTNHNDLVLDIESGYCLYNDVPVTKASGTLRAGGTNGWNFVDINPLNLSRPEGSATGSLYINPDELWLSFDVTSTIDPLHALRIIRISEEPVTLPMAFDNPSEVTMKGIYGFKVEQGLTDISGKARSPAVVSSGIKFENAVANIHMSDTLWTLTNITADVLGGHAAGYAEFLPNPTNPADVYLRANGKLSGLKHTKWGPIIGQTEADKGSEGKMDVTFALQGPIVTNDVEFLTGLSGSTTCEIRKAQLYRIPLFAGLTKVLAANVPGVDFLIAQDDLDATSTITNGMAIVKDLRISGNLFSASGYGTVAFDGTVNLKLKGHLLNRRTLLGKSMYYILFPVSKILEFQATGNIENPSWSSGAFSKNPIPPAHE